MIICDAKYLAELRRMEKAERKEISRADWIAIDTEIGLLWERPDQVMFRTKVAALAFRVRLDTLQHRINVSYLFNGNYQGQVSEDQLGKLGTWWDWAAVNKVKRRYSPWADTNDTIMAFRLSHAIVRYRELIQNSRKRKDQTKLDKRSLENGNETLRQ